MTTDWRTAAQFLMSGIVLLAGLYVALIAESSSDQRLFGWVLVVAGALGLAVGEMMRRRPRR